MNLKFIYGIIALVIIGILFIKPFDEEEKKVSLVSKERIIKEEVIVKKTKVLEKENNNSNNGLLSEKTKDFKLENFHNEQKIKANDVLLENTLAKLDKILKEKNIKLQKVTLSQEELATFNIKIEKIKNEISKVNNK